MNWKNCSISPSDPYLEDRKKKNKEKTFAFVIILLNLYVGMPDHGTTEDISTHPTTITILPYSCCGLLMKLEMI